MIGQIRLPVARMVRYIMMPNTKVKPIVGRTVRIGWPESRFLVWSSAKISDESTATAHSLYP